MDSEKLLSRRRIVTASTSALICSAVEGSADAQETISPAGSTASSTDSGEPPMGVGNSDSTAVREIVAMELALQQVYNKEFLKDPASALKFYLSSPTTKFYDIFFPGEYQGVEVKAFFDRIGPNYVGTLTFADIKVRADSRVGFVYMKQHYAGKDLKGNPFLWIMRQTDGVVKENGEWKIAHTHISFPVDEHTLVATTTGWPQAKLG